MQKLVWRVKLVADFGDDRATEVEVTRIERDEFAVTETLGLSLAEGNAWSLLFKRKWPRKGGGDGRALSLLCALRIGLAQ